MATDIRLIANGTTYYLVGNPGAQGGDPTAAATTPFSLLDEGWTMAPAEPRPVFAGGPPFRNGSDLAYQSYDNTTQSIPLIVDGSSHDNAANLIRTLRRVLGSATTIQPAVLYYQPHSATSALYFNVLTGMIRERTNPMNPAEGFGYVEADMAVTLAPFGGRLSTGETLLSAVSFTNTGTGTPDNIAPYTTGAGDLIYEGQPLNILLQTTGGATSLQKVYLATIDSRIYDAGAAGAKSSTNTTVGTDNTVSTQSIANVLTNHALKCRVMMRFSAMTSNARIKVKASMTNVYFVGAEIDPDNNATIVDMGAVPIDVFRQLDTSASLALILNVRSTDGGTATATLSYVEIILYYDWCVVNGAATTDKLKQQAFTEATNFVCMPKDMVRFTSFSGSTPIVPWAVRGSPPRYFSGSSLYLAWIDNGNLHDTTDTMNATATHAPLYTTMRGAG